MILIPQSVVYRGLLTGLRISSVDGTAFLDNCAALVPYADGNHLVEIYPSGGGALGLKGFLKAQGAGETLDSELVVNGAFAADTDWNKDAGWAIAGTAVKSSDAAGYKIVASAAVSYTIGSLYKGVLDVVAASGNYAFGVDKGQSFTSVYIMTIGTVTKYTTFSSVADSKPVIWMQKPGYTGTFDNFSIKKVLTPSTDGCTIVSTKGGATQSFATVQEGFAYNAAAYSVVVRKAR